jgi:hypothetical protein
VVASRQVASGRRAHAKHVDAERNPRTPDDGLRGPEALSYLAQFLGAAQRVHQVDATLIDRG